MSMKILMIALFILLGIMFSLGKWSFLIAGFNTMTKEEKAKYDVMSLCKFMGKLMFIIAFCITLFTLSDIFMMKILFNIGTVILIVSIIFTIIYANTGNRFKRKNQVYNINAIELIAIDEMIGTVVMDFEETSNEVEIACFMSEEYQL